LFFTIKEIKSMIEANSYYFDDWLQWADLVMDALNEFKSRFGIFPNALLANEFTLSHLDYYTSTTDLRDNLLDDDGSEEFIQLCEFASPEFCVEFYLSDDMEDREFMLALLSEDEQDNEDDEDDDNDGWDSKDVPVRPMAQVG
jgi:hypothetical protein